MCELGDPRRGVGRAGGVVGPYIGVQTGGFI